MSETEAEPIHQLLPAVDGNFSCRCGSWFWTSEEPQDTHDAFKIHASTETDDSHDMLFGALIWLLDQDMDKDYEGDASKLIKDFAESLNECGWHYVPTAEQ